MRFMSSSVLHRFHIGTILFPNHGGTWFVVSKIGLRTPVAVNRVTIGRLVKVNVETAVVRGIGGFAAKVYHIVCNGGAGLSTEGIDTACIVELKGKILYNVTVYVIVAHAGVMTCPSPAYTDTGIVHLVNKVLSNFHITHITTAYTHTAPVFIGGVGDAVVGDTDALGIACVILCQGIRTVHFTYAVAKRSAKDGIAAYVGAVNMTDLLDRMIDSYDIIEAENQSIRKDFGDADRAENNKPVRYGERTRRVKHQSVESMEARQQTIHFSPEDVPDLPELHHDDDKFDPDTDAIGY